MGELSRAFQERLQETETYLSLLEALERQVQQRSPQLGEGFVITVQQQRILYSSVYLQLYNLIESTITLCTKAVSDAVINTWKPNDLSIHLRDEWVRHVARTHVDLNFENRLKHALELFEQLAAVVPVSNFEVEKGGGGNWDHDNIKKISTRLGLQLRISPAVYQNITRPYRDDKPALTYIKNLRNDLAHGSLSFAESSEEVTVSDLRDLTERTAQYLTEVVNCFESSIAAYEFLAPEKRPGGGNP